MFGNAQSLRIHEPPWYPCQALPDIGDNQALAFGLFHGFMRADLTRNSIAGGTKKKKSPKAIFGSHFY